MSAKNSGQAPGISGRKRRASSNSLSRASHIPENVETSPFLENSELLPPNTGPAGVATVTNGANSTASSGKSLSHVPCKFFRQGICQAGKSCPFSHDLEGSLSADRLPCKYFQKGNCKFGLKCALAHILPDGTRVNSRNMQGRRNHDQFHRSRAYSTGSSVRSTQFDVFSNSDHKSESTFSSSDENAAGSSPPSLISPSTTAFLKDSRYVNTAGYSSHKSGLGQELWSYNVGSVGAYSGKGPNSNLGPSAFEFSPPSRGGNRQIFSQHSPVHSSFPLFGPSIQTSCAVEDDDELSEDAYFEDYIPEALGNLLFTPQEKKRRDSRSQSGTLLERPDIFRLSSTEKKIHLPSFLDGDGSGDHGVFVME